MLFGQLKKMKKSIPNKDIRSLGGICWRVALTNATRQLTIFNVFSQKF